ncbi:MAG: hypothetical protein NZ455_00255 [Bacteroidia bacterium]|nr:hypothetical protein [Bacteroidia bacterium]
MRRVRQQCEAPKRKRSPQHADPSAAKGHAQKNNCIFLTTKYCPLKFLHEQQTNVFNKLRTVAFSHCKTFIYSPLTFVLCTTAMKHLFRTKIKIKTQNT